MARGALIPAPPASSGAGAFGGGPFLAACQGRPIERPPIWILRQAGRYLPEYRALRARHSFLELIRTPELAAEATLLPLRRFALDAAILFADILSPLDAFELGLDFAPGPVLARPIRSAAAVDALPSPGGEATSGAAAAAIRILRRELPEQTPLIAFAGAPWTLFCYVVEGRGGNGFPTALRFLAGEPAAAERLLDRLADLAIDHLAEQARAGARALMLFDSWAGLLDIASYRRLALPRVRRILEALAPFELPRIYFPRSAAAASGAELLAAAAALPLEVLHVDFRTPLALAREIAGDRIALEGNLDPALLGPSSDSSAGGPALDRAVEAVLANAGHAGGHIFNLGDGIGPDADPDRVARLVELVHAHRRHGAAA